MPPRDPSPDEPFLSPPPVTAPDDVRGRGVGAGCMLVFGVGILTASVVVLILWSLEAAGAERGPRSSETLGLTLAALTGLVWIVSAVCWWRRRLGLTLAGTVLALVLGAVAAWLIRQP